MKRATKMIKFKKVKVRKISLRALTALQKLGYTVTIK